MTTTQKITIWSIAFTLGTIVPLVSFPLIDKCSPIGDANFWLPFVSISCPAELFGQAGCFIVGFAFTIIFFVTMAIQLLVLGALNDLGVIGLDFIGSIGNSILFLPLLVGLFANTFFYQLIVHTVVSMVQSQKIKSVEV